MFIHIGGDTMVRLSDIIGIFDIQAKLSPNQQLGSNQRIEAPGPDIKSFVLTNHQVYYSPVSSQTLKRRALQLNFSDEAE